MFVNALVHDRKEPAAEDRFGESVADRGEEGADLVDVEAGDDDHALERARVVDAEVLHHGDAVALRENDIEKDGVVVMTAEAVEGLVAVAGDRHLVTFCFEEASQQRSRDRVVFDYQQGGTHFRNYSIRRARNAAANSIDSFTCSVLRNEWSAPSIHRTSIDFDSAYRWTSFSVPNGSCVP